MMKAWLRSGRLVRLEHPVSSGVLLRGAALAFVVAVLAIAMLPSNNANSKRAAIPTTMTSADPLSADLMRCRTVTTEQLAVDDTCRRAWAENRRRFFAPSSSRSDTAVHDPAAARTTRGKAQDRLPAAGVQSDRDEVR